MSKTRLLLVFGIALSLTTVLKYLSAEYSVAAFYGCREDSADNEKVQGLQRNWLGDESYTLGL